DILRDVVADSSVAARGGVTKLSIFIKQRDRHAVDFWLDHNRDLFIRQKLRNARIKIRDLLLGIGIVEAKHRNQMRDLLERLQRFSAYALRRRIRRRQLRELCFKVDKLLIELVV